MPTSYTSLLGLALPVQGELSGTWGDTVNDYITKYVDASVAGTQTISGSQTAVTLSTTTGTTLSQAGSGATGSSQYMVINCTGNPGGLLTITAPAASKAYLVLNNTSTAQSVKIVGVGPTTGVTIASAQNALVVWNGSDFELVATIDASKLSGILGVANGGTGNSTIPARSVFVANTLDTLTTVTPAAGQSIRINAGNTAWEAYTPSTGTGDAVLANNNAFTGANTFYNSTGQTFGTGTSTQDGLILAGRAGGSSSYRVTLTPTTLTASRTVTFPNANTTVPVASQVLTFSGPSAARTYTLPDADSTLVSTAATQTLTAKTLTDPAIIGTILEDVYTISDGAAFEVDPGNGSIQLITLGANRTPKATNFAAGEAITLMVDDGSAYTITWTDATWGGSGVIWETDGGTAPTLSTSGYTTIVLWKVSTQVYGARVGNA